MNWFKKKNRVDVSYLMNLTQEISEECAKGDIDAWWEKRGFKWNILTEYISKCMPHGKIFFSMGMQLGYALAEKQFKEQEKEKNK